LKGKVLSWLGILSERPVRGKLKRKKIFTRDEILSLRDAANISLRAVILLGINAGFGNTDMATLQKLGIDLMLV
jgi:hypothetical protein